ncbi:DMT family protein [Vogesella sp. DC21W]|uniref:DMT family protein n=1 Tax=Vogesella aquatica TaxID=2984206 RepID=A0ABT5IZD3_9NEIS|nr:DMT family protein [Vogesella aquatica]MDC7717938.1 DMT family protein [Vogesella aquatica]
MADTLKEYAHLNKTCKTHSLSNDLPARLQLPAHRIGYGMFTLSQLKIIRKVIRLSVLIPFAMLCAHPPFKWDYVQAGTCLAGTVYFMFRG